MVLPCQLPEVAVDIVRIAALGFQLNGHVFDPKVRRDPVLNQLQQLRRGVMTFDHDMAGEHDQSRFDRPDMKIVHVLDSGIGFHSRGDMQSTDSRRR